MAAGFAPTLGKVAGLGVLAKFGIGATVAAASVAGAGAAGVLPDQADDAVRSAIEVVSPVDFAEDTPAADHSGGDQTNFGDRVSADATGESDGVPGVDGSQISSEAPGAAHRPADAGAAADDAGAAADSAGDQAGDTPAADHMPDDAAASGGAETPAASSTVPSVPSTVPGPATDAGQG